MTKGIKEGRLDWEEFKRLFKEKYLYERFYGKKNKEFHDMKMGSMAIDGFIAKFLELLHYVPYIKEESKRFLSYLPTYIAYKIEFDAPKTLNEALYKAWLCYKHIQGRSKNKDKNQNIKRSYSERRNKGCKQVVHRNQHSKFPSNKNFQNNKPTNRSEYHSNILA